MKVDFRRFLFFIDRFFYFLLIYIPQLLKRTLSKTEHELNSLIKLSEASASIAEEIDVNKEELIKKCVENFNSIYSYSSRILMTDKSYPATPTSFERLVGRWRATFIQPHKTHVIQEMFDDELGWVYDEWIMSDDNQFVNMGFWILLPKGETANVEANQNVLVNNWINLISSQPPEDASFYRYKRTPYLLLTYSPSINSKGFTGTLFTEMISKFSKGCKIQVWVNAATLYIAKGVIQYEGKVDEEYGFARVSAIFGGYNEVFEINTPEYFQTMTNEQQSLKITSEDELDNFISHYYLFPQPELVPKAIKFIGDQKYASKESTQKMILIFFSCVFSQNEGKKDEWQRVIEDQDGETKHLLLEAMNKSVSELLNKTKISPLLNDMCWSAFFASGDTSYINKIIDNLKYMGERKDMDLFSAAATAKWSLASNAQRHPKVKAALKNLSKNSDPEVRRVAKDMLNKDPEKIVREMNKIVEKQQKKGVW